MLKTTGHIREKDGICYMVINAGYIEGKRNRIQIPTDLKLRGNKRKLDTMLGDTLTLLDGLHEQTGERSLKRLYELSKRAQEEIEAPFESNKAQGMQAQPPKNEDKHLFADVIEQWLRYSKLGMDENTHAKYSYACVRIVPYFRELGVHVEDLLPDHFTEYYLKQVEGDPDKGLKPLSPATLSAHHTVLRSAVNYSIESLRIVEAKNNPIATVSAPKKGRRMPTFYTDKQLNRTFESIRGLPIEPCVIIAANYGFRRGEVLGLKWDAINFEPTSKNPHGTITVRHTVVRVGNKVKQKDEGKNFESWRTLPLSEQLASYLRRLYAHQRQMQAKYGSQYVVNNYICKWDDGRPFKPDYVTRSWSSFLKRMGQPHIRFHDLRHSSASLLVTLGFQLKEIQEWLGHKDPRSTDIYAHLYTDKNDMASKVNERLIFDFGEYER